ncbi:Uncharacterised protein [Vibrio cholerae]|nr:Uncharacterised protein [Vibrio cholerae]CSD08753.1 Uncharacterised protein [Vibrio cholerae]CSI34148.1 Uncharacterised protein [Vibrio cholerae]
MPRQCGVEQQIAIGDQLAGNVTLMEKFQIAERNQPSVTNRIGSSDRLLTETDMCRGDIGRFFGVVFKLTLYMPVLA